MQCWLAVRYFESLKLGVDSRSIKSVNQWDSHLHRLTSFFRFRKSSEGLTQRDTIHERSFVVEYLNNFSWKAFKGLILFGNVAWHH